MIVKLFPAEAPRPSQQEDNAKVLSAAECDILPWLNDGKTNWEIARILNKSEFTIKNQIAGILRKTGAKSRHDLANVQFQT